MSTTVRHFWLPFFVTKNAGVADGRSIDGLVFLPFAGPDALLFYICFWYSSGCTAVVRCRCAPFFLGYIFLGRIDVLRLSRLASVQLLVIVIAIR